MSYFVPAPSDCRSPSSAWTGAVRTAPLSAPDGHSAPRLPSPLSQRQKWSPEARLCDRNR
eukprot:6038046-Pyramimonas_sp.AAC.1